jgi:hypothetical protein
MAKRKGVWGQNPTPHFHKQNHGPNQYARPQRNEDVSNGCAGPLFVIVMFSLGFLAAIA